METISGVAQGWRHLVRAPRSLVLGTVLSYKERPGVGRMDRDPVRGEGATVTWCDARLAAVAPAGVSRTTQLASNCGEVALDGACVTVATGILQDRHAGGHLTEAIFMFEPQSVHLCLFLVRKGLTFPCGPSLCLLTLPRGSLLGLPLFKQAHPVALIAPEGACVTR